MDSGIPKSVLLASKLYFVWAIFYLLVNSIAVGMQLAATYSHEAIYTAKPAITQSLRQMGYGQLIFMFIMVLGTGYLIRTNQMRGKVLFLLFTLWRTYETVITFPGFEGVTELGVLTNLMNLTLTISISVLLLKSLFNDTTTASGQ